MHLSEYQPTSRTICGMIMQLQEILVFSSLGSIGGHFRPQDVINLPSQLRLAGIIVCFSLSLSLKRSTASVHPPAGFRWRENHLQLEWRIGSTPRLSQSNPPHPPPLTSIILLRRRRRRRPLQYGKSRFSSTAKASPSSTRKAISSSASTNTTNLTRER